MSFRKDDDSPSETLVMDIEAIVDGLRLCTDEGSKPVAYCQIKGSGSDKVLVLWNGDGTQEYIYVDAALRDLEYFLSILPDKIPEE